PLLRSTFEFQSGTFKKAWREIPVSRTDGVTIVGATMDGAVITQGDGPGHISVTSKNRKQRVEWHFAEVGPSVHRFQLHYVARGAVYREGGDDVIRWRALPQEHAYRIDASRIHLELPGANIRTPETRRVGSLMVNNSSEGVTVEAEDIQSNGWIIAELRYDAGQLIDAEPQWQQRD